MKLPWLKTLLGFLLATVLTAPAWAADQALPGSLNYIEGQAYIGDQQLNAKSIGSVALQPGQSLTTENGKAEILLTPGVFLRVGDNSTVRLVSSNLTNTEADLVKGQATVEVAEIHPYNNLQIGEDGARAQLLKDGLYGFDANQQQVLVLKGEAMVQDSDQNVKVKGGHELNLNSTGSLKTAKFDKNAYEASDLYHFSDLRSSYLAEANVNMARQYYAGGTGWYGPGWYWDPWFWSYTWLPGDGIFYDPFGWGFYSPWFVGYAPFSTADMGTVTAMAVSTVFVIMSITYMHSRPSTDSRFAAQVECRVLPTSAWQARRSPVAAAFALEDFAAAVSTVAAVDFTAAEEADKLAT